jgi:hypothetical protein
MALVRAFQDHALLELPHRRAPGLPAGGLRCRVGIASLTFLTLALLAKVLVWRDHVHTAFSRYILTPAQVSDGPVLDVDAVCMRPAGGLIGSRERTSHKSIFLVLG